MKLPKWLMPAGLLVIALAPLPAQSAPLGALEGVASSASQNPMLEQVHSRYRYWRHRHYRRHRHGAYFYFAPRRHHHHYRRWY
jgi:hypothetical protein